MHPYHNNPILNEIREVEAELRNKRREFELKTVKPLKDKINQLRLKREQELINYDLKAYRNNH